MLAAGVGLLALALGGCAAAPPPLDASGDFAIERFFAGSSASRGEIRTLFFWSENFTADFTGSGNGAVFALDEHFHFADGERLQRWSLRALADGRYEGTVQTESGAGTLGPPVPVAGYRTAHGAVLDYDGYAPGGGSTVLHFRHVMEAQGDGTVSNTVRISKFGLPVAGAAVVFFKVPQG